MIQQTTSLLRVIWDTSPWRDDLLATFSHWVRRGASRSEASHKLKALVEARLATQTTSHPLDIDLEQVHWGQITEFFCACYYRKRRRAPLPDVPSDTLWEQLIEEKYWAPLSFHPQQDKAIQHTVPVPYVPLEQKLLRLGGKRMIYRNEPDLDSLLIRGELLHGSVELIPGEERECHSNSFQLWSENKEAFSLVTGCGLSEDGLWRQHSWIIRKRPTSGQARIIETTLQRTKYFGFILTDAEAEAFSY